MYCLAERNQWNFLFVVGIMDALIHYRTLLVPGYGCDKKFISSSLGDAAMPPHTRQGEP